MTPLFTQKVTIYNNIPETAVEPRRFDRFVISQCTVQGGFVDKANGTIRNVVNAKTVITKDTEHYKSPDEYTALPTDQRANFYTVQMGDFAVFSEVDDVVTTAMEFSQLQQKYKNNGIKVSSVSSFLNGMGVDNVTFTNA